MKPQGECDSCDYLEKINKELMRALEEYVNHYKKHGPEILGNGQAFKSFFKFKALIRKYDKR